MDGERALTPTQERVLSELMGKGEPRPDFDPALALRLRSDLEIALAAVADGVGDHQLVVHKAALAQVHACEAHHLAEVERGFTWSPATAMGAVAHKAIELSAVMRHAPGPAELVELALERLAADPDRGPGAWLAVAGEVELAELRAGALDRTLKFADEFPPINLRWRPRIESTLLTALCGDRIVLRGKVDLALGRAEGSRAGVLIVDFKTGRPARNHADDLRFYALLETLRAGVPPFRVASWYLDSGQCHREDVDVPALEAAARRVVDGARKLYELSVEGRPPRLQPGPCCEFCPARGDCEGAARWHQQRPPPGLGQW